MDFSKQFRYVQEIAEAGSISLAAERLGIAQPALSKYLRHVEDEFGARLFDRSSTPIRLTEAGRAFCGTGARILDAERQLLKERDEISGRHDRELTVGIGATRAPYLMPPLVRAYAEARPKGRIRVIEDTTDRLSAGLASGELDMIISLQDETTAEFEPVFLTEERVLLAVPKRFSGGAEEALKGLPFVSAAKGQPLWETLRRLGEPEIAYECRNLLTAEAFVAEGLGAALLPSYMAAGGERRGIRYLPLPQTAATVRRVCLFYRKDQFLSEAEKSLIRCALSLAEREELFHAD